MSGDLRKVRDLSRPWTLDGSTCSPVCYPVLVLLYNECIHVFYAFIVLFA